MSNIANEKKEKIVEKLKYIGLDLEGNIPDNYKNYDTIDFRPDRMYTDSAYRVYKYIPINDIQIVITTANRMSSIQEKYKNASPIYNYLVPENQEDMMKYSKFLKMVEEVQIEEIEEIAEEQDKFNKYEPFKIKYNKDYLWEIYYIQYLNKYFMVVTTEDKNNATLFYILREQLKNSKQNKKIYVPICCMDYSRDLLGREEYKDLEKYIWQFTKEWPMIYNVFDKEGNESIQIYGKTVVYGKIESIYKIKLSSKEEAVKFLKLIKALFILETEFPHDYIFDIQIAQDGGIEFVYNTKIIKYENLAAFVKNEYLKKAETLRIIKKEEKILTEVLNTLKKTEAKQEQEYLQKQNQVATFLNCRKSFFGKVRYFFKGKIKQELLKNEPEEAKIEIDEEEIKQTYEREFYTIDDLIIICKELNEILNNVKNIRMDKKALEVKNSQLKIKINNANKFIEEIESHKKSIFEFWKFANKDKNLALESATIIEEPKDEIVSNNEYYDYIEDKEEIGIKIDKEQREKLSKKETDAIFLLKTKIFDQINAIKIGEKYNFTSELENLKNDFRSIEFLFGNEDYDIFGNSMDDNTKINILGNKKHREKKKDIYKILDINTENIDTIGYVSKLHGILNTLNKVFEKNCLGIKLNVFKVSSVPFETKKYCFFNINPENALKERNNDDMVALYSIHLNQDTPSVGMSNIIYYDNFNKTLPIGMNIGDEILLDMDKLKLELKRQKLFRINSIIDEFNIKTKTVCVYEYEIQNKKDGAVGENI